MKVKDTYHQLHLTMTAIDHSKKIDIVAKLLMTKYKDQLEKVMPSGVNTLLAIFKNKPDQLFELQFPAFDTWDQIKRKMDKLMESDGICVVCCEPEKPKKTERKVRCGKGCECGKTVVNFERPTGICATCCEMLCKSCWGQMYTTKCPVCRTCTRLYAHKLKNEECHCESDSEDE
jgi:hypothetical protein